MALTEGDGTRVLTVRRRVIGAMARAAAGFSRNRKARTFGSA